MNTPPDHGCCVAAKIDLNNFHDTSFFSIKPRGWLGRISLKWHILCRVGPKTLTQSINQHSDISVTVSKCLCRNVSVSKRLGSESGFLWRQLSWHQQYAEIMRMWIKRTSHYLLELRCRLGKVCGLCGLRYNQHTVGANLTDVSLCMCSFALFTESWSIVTRLHHWLVTACPGECCGRMLER